MKNGNHVTVLKLDGDLLLIDLGENASFAQFISLQEAVLQGAQAHYSGITFEQIVFDQAYDGQIVAEVRDYPRRPSV